MNCHIPITLLPVCGQSCFMYDFSPLPNFQFIEIFILSSNATSIAHRFIFFTDFYTLMFNQVLETMFIIGELYPGPGSMG